MLASGLGVIHLEITVPTLYFYTKEKKGTGNMMLRSCLIISLQFFGQVKMIFSFILCKTTTIISRL